MFLQLFNAFFKVVSDSGKNFNAVKKLRDIQSQKKYAMMKASLVQFDTLQTVLWQRNKYSSFLFSARLFVSIMKMGRFMKIYKDPILARMYCMLCSTEKQ